MPSSGGIGLGVNLSVLCGGRYFFSRCGTSWLGPAAAPAAADTGDICETLLGSAGSLPAAAATAAADMAGCSTLDTGDWVTAWPASEL